MGPEKSSELYDYYVAREWRIANFACVVLGMQLILFLVVWLQWHQTTKNNILVL